MQTTILNRRLFFAGGRGAATQGAIAQSGDVCDDDRWGGPETERAAEDVAYLPCRRPPKVFRATEGDGTYPVGVESIDRDVDRCSKKGRQVLPGGPRTSRTVHGQVAQG